MTDAATLSDAAGRLYGLLVSLDGWVTEESHDRDAVDELIRMGCAERLFDAVRAICPW